MFAGTAARTSKSSDGKLLVLVLGPVSTRWMGGDAGVAHRDIVEERRSS
jgi:hypothetical protein